jgi:hypothetical protein
VLAQRYLENSVLHWEGRSMKRPLELVSLALFICLVPGGLARGQVAINVNPALPSDIAGGAPAATLQQAAAFAWQEFIALNWPAMQSTGRWPLKSLGLSRIGRQQPGLWRVNQKRQPQYDAVIWSILAKCVIFGLGRSNDR